MAKILVIDDDDAIRRTISRTLRRSGHEVILAKDGAEGVLKYRAERPDIVITDIFMPKQEGVETILELRRENPRVSILAISGGTFESLSYLEMTQKLGADATLQKPFRPAELLRAIDKLLASPG